MAERPPCCFESVKGFDSAPGWRRTGWAKFTVEFRIRDRSSLEFGTFSVAISQNGQAALFGGLWVDVAGGNAYGVGGCCQVNQKAESTRRE